MYLGSNAIDTGCLDHEHKIMNTMKKYLIEFGICYHNYFFYVVIIISFPNDGLN